MKISTLLPLLCALAAGTIGLSVRAEDNPAQAAARQALARQLLGRNAAPVANAATPMPANVEVMPDNKRAAQAKGTVNPAQAEPPAASVAKPETNQLSDADRAAQMAALMARMNAGAPAKSAPNQPTAQSAAPVKTAVPTQTGEKSQPASAVQPTAALLQVLQSSDANYAGKDLGMKPIAAPALPIPPSKEEQLQILLLRYKADQITPEEYHKQRAEILAQP